jgi:V/A-type H+-transporting ATPase subunit D
LSVATGRRVLPTKIELIRIRRSLAVSKKVHKILEDKREVLLKRLDEMIARAHEARESLGRPLLEAYDALYDAYFSMGPMRLEATAYATPVRVGVEVAVKRVVDVDVPLLKMEVQEEGLTYGFADTTSDLDRATRKIRATLPGLLRAAEVETAIFRLAGELEKTQRLINALEYIIIPQYEESVRYITSTLEEREREEFVRLKHVKRVIERRRGEAR